MKMQLGFKSVISKPNIGRWRERYFPCLFNLSNLSLAIGYITLLFYALFTETGNIVSLPTKTIGFLNFCLWNEEAEKLDCLLSKDLEKLGINQTALILSMICVYSTFGLCLFAAATILLTLCLKDRDGWKLSCFFLTVCVLALPAGLLLFLFQTQRWIQISELGKVFAALIGAHALILFHSVITGMYIAKFKDALLPR